MFKKLRSQNIKFDGNGLFKSFSKLINKNLYEQVQDPTKNIKKKIAELVNKLFKQKKINLKEKLDFSRTENFKTCYF